MPSKLLKILLLLTLLTVGTDDYALAQRKTRKASRQNYETEQKKLKKQIADTEQKLDENSKNIKTQSRNIKLREEQIKQRQQLIAIQKKHIEELNDDENMLSQHIERLEKSHETKQKKYAAAVRQMYKWRTGHEWLRFIISAQSVAESMRRARLVMQVIKHTKNQALEIREEQQESEETRQQLNTTRTDHEHTLASISSERDRLAKLQEKQKAELTTLENDKKKLETSLERDRKRMAEVERQIQRMIEQAAAEAKRKAEAEAKRKAEAEAKAAKAAAAKQKNNNTKKNAGSNNTATPKRPATPTNSVPTDARLTGSFASNKGKMSYPVDQAFTVTSRYSRAANGNSSIVITTKRGAKACSVFEGTVMRTFKSTEEWTVIIGHGDYRTVYMNLQNVTVRDGQKVSTRQPIGTIKPEPNSTKAELRFWIYKDANPINPEVWLKR